MDGVGALARWLTTRRQRLVDRGAEQMMAGVVRHAERRRGPAPATVACWILAGLVHLGTLSLLVAGVALVVAPFWVLKPIGGLLVLLAVAVTWWPEPDEKGTVLLRAEAPHLYRLVDRVADCGGAPAPHRIVVIDDFNAYAGGTLRRTLGLGAPLWAALPTQARVAMLGHELGHFAHRDAMSGWWVGRARWTLARWSYLVDFSDDTGYFGPDLAAVGSILIVLTTPIRAIVTGLLYALYVLNAAGGRRQEYLADVAAIHAGGSDAARDVFDTLLAEHTVSAALTRAAVGRERPDPWAVVRESLSAAGPDTRTNRRTAARDDRNRLDDSHPQTWLRLSLVDALPYRTAQVVPDAGEWRAIERELATALESSGKRITEAIRSSW